MRRIGANACAGGTSTTTVRVSVLRRAGAPSSIALTKAARSGIGSIRNVSRAAVDRTTVEFFSPSTSARPTRACAGVTSASQRPDRCGVSTGTGSSSRRSPRKPRVLAASCRRRTTTSGPPISKTAAGSSGRSSAASRYASTSSMAMGCVSVATQRGQTMTGSRSTSA